MHHMKGMLRDEEKLQMLDLQRRDNAEKMRRDIGKPARSNHTAEVVFDIVLSIVFLAVAALIILGSLYFLFRLLGFVVRLIS